MKLRTRHNLLLITIIGFMTVLLLPSSIFVYAINNNQTMVSKGHIGISKAPIGVTKGHVGVIKGLGPAAPTPHTYIFKLLYMIIHNTRSLKTDTNHVTAGVQVGQEKEVTMTTGQPGVDSSFNGCTPGGDGGCDQRKGTHSINLALPPVTANNVVNFEFLIANKGSSVDYVTLGATGAGLLSRIDPEPYSKAVLTALSAVAPVVKILAPGLYPGACDGTVAGARFQFTPDELYKLTSSPPTPPHLVSNNYPSAAAGQPTATILNNYPGVDSPAGCGSNSNYDVAFSISRIS